MTVKLEKHIESSYGEEESVSEDLGDDGESSICFENTDLHQYSSEQIKNTNHSPLRFQDTTSDEVLNTQDNHEEQNAIAFGH